jgi:alpha-1,3-rhamnosyl/mannosyltransferase
MRPLKIGLVASSLNVEHVRGMGKYLLDMTACTRPEDQLSWVFFGDNVAQPLYLPRGVAAQADAFEVKGHRWKLWEQVGVPLRGRQHRVDLLHYAENTIAWWQPIPAVVTIHDTLAWETGQPSFYWDQLLPLALRRSRHVITISESSKRDVLRHWPELAAKLTVVPHGVDDAYFVAGESHHLPEALQEALRHRAYLMYMGGPMARKRFEWALEVLAHTPLPDLHLVACGFAATARSAAERQLPYGLRGRVHFAPFLTDVELRALYCNARCLLYPTLYEGFGFPAVEAQACGVPALFSPLGSLEELIGPRAWVLPPFNREAWVDKVQQAVSLPDAARATLRDDARVWAKRFQWRESYRKHVEIYAMVAGRD